MQVGLVDLCKPEMWASHVDGFNLMKREYYEINILVAVILCSNSICQNWKK